jgi:GNAT superfamily N-acetyltransferase
MGRHKAREGLTIGRDTGPLIFRPAETSLAKIQDASRIMIDIRPCREDEKPAILAVINAAAEAYRGVIPADRWHSPYMPPDELDSEIAAGVTFWGHERDGVLVGVMGLQSVRDVDLIRHAYVLPDRQRHGIGAALLWALRRQNARPMLVGTWAAADWAIRFYERHGFELVAPERTAALLRAYWTISERQIETSVVLTKPPVV